MSQAQTKVDLAASDGVPARGPFQSRASPAHEARASSSASSFDATFKIENPPITSFDSVNGPSVVMSFPFVMRMRTPDDVGWRPPNEAPRFPSMAMVMPRRRK